VFELYPSSYTVAPGETVTLSWETFEADEVTLDGEPVAPSGTSDVTPNSTTTYTLEARSSAAPDKVDTSTCTVTVNATPRPVSIDALEVTPDEVEKGQSAVISWTVTNPTTLDLDGERIAPTGTLEVSPLETTTYVLTARGHQGPVAAEVTLEVSEISSGLLPDKGGFVCGLGAHAGSGSPPLLVLLGLAVLVIASRWRPRR
jgi:hypothetical protein